MSKLAVLLLLVGLSSTSFAATPVTVERVEQLLTASHGQPDAKVASHISGLQLTERANSARLARWQAEFPGKKTRDALLALADASAFLDLPPSNIPSTPKPIHDDMQQTMLRAVDYARTTIHKLPDFTARRSTTYFDNLADARSELRAYFDKRTSQRQRQLSSDGADIVITQPQDQAPALSTSPLKINRESSALATYRDGHEVLDAQPVLDPSADADPMQKDLQAGLTTSGELSPILSIVMADASHGRVAWSHWEQGTNGPLAVFRYSVPKEFANFTVLGFANIPQLPAYHGELAVDPATGAILRITVISDWQAPFQDHLSQILVEYGSVLIGDNLYNCPVRGVAITRVPTRTADYGWLGSYALPLQVFVNDVSFTQYRLFRGDVRIIPDAPAPATP